jgi:hypothetical protein
MGGRRNGAVWALCHLTDGRRPGARISWLEFLKPFSGLNRPHIFFLRSNEKFAHHSRL